MVWEMTTRAREWIASVSDVLNPGSDPRTVDGARAVGIQELQRLLSESQSLPVCVSEADEVSRIIHAALEWQRKVDEMLATLQAPTRPRAGRGSNCLRLSTLSDVLEEAQLIPVRLEQRIELKERVESETQFRHRTYTSSAALLCSRVMPMTGRSQCFSRHGIVVLLRFPLLIALC